MRKMSLVLILAILPFISFAQNDTIGNFIQKGTTLIWQKVFNFNPEDSLNVKNFLFNNHTFENEYSETFDRVIGVAYPILKDLCNLDYAERPVFFNKETRIKYIIQLKEDRYRITVTSIEPRDIYGNFTFASAALLDMQDYKNARYLSNIFNGGIWFKNNGELRKPALKVLPILDEVLIKLFKYNYQKAIQIDSDF